MKDMSQYNVLLLADENIPIKLIKLLYDKGFNIKRVDRGSTDKQVFDYAKSGKRILLTFDRHFLIKIKFPPQASFGIIFLQINPPLIDSLYFTLIKLFNTIKPEEFKGRLFIISETKVKIYPK